MKHFGVEYPGQSKEIQTRIRETNMKNFGVSCSFQAEEVKEKIKQTNLKNLGVENPFQSEEIRSHIKQTLIEKYNVTNPTYIPDHVKKSKQTCMDRLGTEYPMQSKQVQEKSKKTCLAKYNTEYVMQSKQVQKKYEQTSLEKWGYRNPSQSPEVKEKKKQTCLKHWNLPHAPSWKYAYDNQFFDSSWELAVWIWACDMEKCIKREPIGFEYEFKGQTHLYFPDFDIDGQLVEVKGSQFFKKDGTMQNPFNHDEDEKYEIKKQCALKHGVQFWNEKEVKPILNYISTQYGKEYLQQFKR